MKPEIRIAALFVFPLVAVIACAVVMFTTPVRRPFTPERPQFLNYIERLGVADTGPRGSLAPESMRNVFSYEEPKAVDQGPAPEAAPAVNTPPADTADGSGDSPPPRDSLAAYEPLWVSMIVEDGKDSFSVINGRTMRMGDRGDGFTLTSIRKGSVIIRRTNGTEEIIHVKAF